MPRLKSIHANLVNRLDEAKEQGWLGEVAAIETTLAAAEQKLGTMRSAAAQHHHYPGDAPFRSCRWKVEFQRLIPKPSVHLLMPMSAHSRRHREPRATVPFLTTKAFFQLKGRPERGRAPPQHTEVGPKLALPPQATTTDHQSRR